MSSAFTLATWNILATAYIRRDYYPNTLPDVLDPRWRVPALVKRARELDVDILCLQEVEAESFAALEAGLSPLGYSGRLAMKAGRKPDGCAIFFRTATCRLIAEQRIVYTDGGHGPNSGHIGQLAAFDVTGGRLDLLNTHLKWDPPSTPRDRQWGYRQAVQALAALPETHSTGLQIICGDFNVTAASAVIELLSAAGFHRTHHGGPGIYTCNSSREPKLIDFICYRGPVCVRPSALPVIDGATPLPSSDQPSDHLPLVARFTAG